MRAVSLHDSLSSSFCRENSRANGELPQLRFEILAGLAGFDVETAQGISGFENRVHAQIGEPKHRGEEGGIEHALSAAGEHCLDAEEHFQQLGEENKHRAPREKNV